MHVSVYPYLFVSASIHVCVYVCVHVYVSLHMYVCGVPNIKLVSLACMPDEPDSAKYKNGICMCVCLCMCMCLCVSISMCM